MLLKTTTGTPTSKLDSNDTSHGNTQDRLAVPAQNTSDVHKHTATSAETLSDQAYLNIYSHNLSQILKKTKQIIMDICPSYVTKSYRN